MRRAAPFLVLFFSVTGCVHEAAIDFESPADRPDEAVVEPTTERDVDVSSDGPSEEAPDVVVVPTTPAAARPLIPPDPVLFRIGAGYGVLGQVDFAPCREQGLGRGYLHVRVTFRHNGRVVHAIVERPAPPPDEALHCIAEQLQLAMVPVFDGDDVTLSKSYFVN
jgi:hypothetical protein